MISPLACTPLGLLHLSKTLHLLVPRAFSSMLAGKSIARSSLVEPQRQPRDGAFHLPGTAAAAAAAATHRPSAAAGPCFAAASFSSTSRAPASREHQLRFIKDVNGIGKSYEKLLRQQGIQTVEELSEKILKQLSAAADDSVTDTPAIKYLQGLGIRRQDHAQRIVQHITAVYAPALHNQLTQQRDAPDAAAAPGKAVGPEITFCVEGNISAGKSTFLQYITNNNPELQQELGVVHEPVEQWQQVPTVEGGTLNLLDRFYAEPEKYAYSFQNYVFMSRVLQERNSAHIQQPVRLMERSVFSDRMVFVRAVRESGWMGDVELAVYDSWFGPILDTNPSLVPDGFIYLKCDPSTCMERLKMRGRHEEETIPITYLEGLHAKHEDWLGAGMLATLRSRGHHDLQQGRQPSFAAGNGGLLLPKPPVLEIPARLHDSLYFLNKDGPNAPKEMHVRLHHVPALVLDCNADVLRDTDLQQEVQNKVRDYISFIRNNRGSSGGLGGNSWAAGLSRGTQPGGPQGQQLEPTKLVQHFVAEEEAKAVANCSGVLHNAHGNGTSNGSSSIAADSLQHKSSSSSSRGPTGSLEVLHTAIAGM